MSVPLLLGAVFMFFLYESPKYLASRGESEKALEVLEKMYEINGGKRGEYPVKQIIIEEDTSQKTFLNSLSEHTAPIFKRPLLWRTVQLFFLIALCCATNNVFVMWFPTIVDIFFKSFSGGTMDTSLSFCERINKDSQLSSSLTSDTLFLDGDTCDDKISTNTIYSGIVFGFFFLILNLGVTKFASRPRLVLITILVISGVSANLINLRHPAANLVFLALIQITATGIGCVAFYFVDLYPTANRGLVSSLGIMVARIASLIGVNVMGAVINTHCQMVFYCWSVILFGGALVTLLLPPDRKSAV